MPSIYFLSNTLLFFDFKIIVIIIT